MAWSTGEQTAYTSIYTKMWGTNINVSHSGTNITITGTVHIKCGSGTSLNNATRYVTLVYNGSCYYGVATFANTAWAYNGEYSVNFSKTINISSYGSGSATVGFYVSTSNSGMGSSTTLVFNGSTNKSGGSPGLKTCTISWSASATSVGKPGKPSATQYVKANDKVSLSWSAASAGTNNAVKHYKIQYQFYNGSSWGSWIDWTTTTSTSYSGTLSSIGGWSFRVIAVNTISAFSDQTSDYSTPYTYTWTNVGNPSNFKISSGQYQTGNFSFTWSAASAGNNNSVSYYTIDGTNVGNVTTKGTYSVTAGSSKTYTLKTVGARGDTSSGVTYTVYNPTLTFSTSAPTLSNTTVYTDALTVSWSAASKTAASGLSIKYTLQKSINNGSWTDVATGLTSTSYNATEAATWGQTVKFRVIAYLYSGTTTYRSGTTDSSASIMRGNLPSVIPKITFINDWYENNNNTGWPHEIQNTPDFDPVEITNTSNAPINFNNNNFTLAKHTRIKILLPSNTASIGGGSEKLYINGIGVTIFDSDSEGRYYMYYPNDYISTLELKFVNIYNNVEVSRPSNPSWIISNIRIPLALTVQNDSYITPTKGNLSRFEYNIVDEVKTTINNIVLNLQAPFVRPNAYFNRNIGFQVLTSTNQTNWKKVTLQSGDVQCPNVSGIIQNSYYINGIIFPEYTTETETETGTDSRFYQQLKLNINLKEERWIPYNDNSSNLVDLTILNTAINPKTFYYKIVPINKYDYADNRQLTLISQNSYVAAFVLDTSAQLTLPEHPTFCTNGLESTGYNTLIQRHNLQYRIFNNGANNKKSYLLFEFYAGLDSNLWYEDGSPKYVIKTESNSKKYYLKSEKTDPLNYQLNIYTLVQKQPEMQWLRKYDAINLTKRDSLFGEWVYNATTWPGLWDSLYVKVLDNSNNENNENENNNQYVYILNTNSNYDSGTTYYYIQTEGYVSTPKNITIGQDSVSVQAYRGWYQINLTDEEIDECVRLMIRPYTAVNYIEQFPSSVTGATSPEPSWYVYDVDSNTPPNTFIFNGWVASTQNPKLSVAVVNRPKEVGDDLVVNYTIRPQGTGSTYKVGWSQKYFDETVTPSDQKLSVYTNIIALNGTTSITHNSDTIIIKNLYSNVAQDKTLTYAYSTDEPEGLYYTGMSESFSYNVNILGDISGTMLLLNGAIPSYDVQSNVNFIIAAKGIGLYLPPVIAPLSIRKYSAGINTTNTAFSTEDGVFFVMSRAISADNIKRKIYYIYDNQGVLEKRSIDILTGEMDGFVINGGNWSDPNEPYDYLSIEMANGNDF